MATDRRIDPAIEYFESNRTRQTFRIESEKERYERERSSMRKCSISGKIIIAKMEMLRMQLRGARFGDVELEPYRRAVELDEMRLEEI